MEASRLWFPLALDGSIHGPSMAPMYDPVWRPGFIRGPLDTGDPQLRGTRPGKVVPETASDQSACPQQNHPQ